MLILDVHAVCTLYDSEVTDSKCNSQNKKGVRWMNFNGIMYNKSNVGSLTEKVQSIFFKKY